MKSAQDILKLSGLMLLFSGTVLVLIPDDVNGFLNAQNLIPKTVILSCGVLLNLTGLLLLQFSKKRTVNGNLKKAITSLQGSWIIVVLITFIMDSWITTVNGMTVLGLWVIMLSWLTWHFNQSK